MGYTIVYIIYVLYYVNYNKMVEPASLTLIYKLHSAFNLYNLLYKMLNYVINMILVWISLR